MNRSRFLLTGATGFVGAHLHAALRRRGTEMEIVGTGTTDAGGCMSLDLLDAEAVDLFVADLKPDIVVHLAAQASAALSAKDVGATWSVNLGGSMNLALAVARHCSEATVLFASLAEVYGASFLNGPASAGTPLLPINPYAKSKAAAERMFANVLPPTARLTVARPFNHTGPGQREDFVLASLAAQVARIEAGLQPPELKVGNLDVRRDFLDVRDMVEAYCALLDAAPRLPHRLTCNVASGKAMAIDIYSTYPRSEVGVRCLGLSRNGYRGSLPNRWQRPGSRAPECRHA